MPKIPQTKPSWVRGTYLLYADDEMLGAFVQFASAWKWREFLAATSSVKVLYITHHGTTINMWRRENAGGAL